MNLENFVNIKDFRKETVKIKQATKLGFIELETPGIANLSFPNSRTRRGRVIDGGKVCGTLQTSNSYSLVEYDSIRELTPLECFKLMGFTEEQYKRASQVCSPTQLYKQAGNSIVVDVLIKLLTPIMKGFEGDTVHILELFGGIGAPRAALERMGYKVISDYVENDPAPVASYNAMFKENHKPKSVTDFNGNGKKYHFVFHGSPCQDFTVAGKMLGGEKGSGTRSSLMWETVRIVDECITDYVIWENVKGVLSKKHIKTFNKYIQAMKEKCFSTQYEIINAVDCGIPQKRIRVFTTSKCNHEMHRLKYSRKNKKRRRTNLIDQHVTKLEKILGD